MLREKKQLHLKNTRDGDGFLLVVVFCCLVWLGFCFVVCFLVEIKSHYAVLAGLRLGIYTKLFWNLLHRQE